MRARFVVLASLAVAATAWGFAALFTALDAASVQATVPVVALGSLCLAFPLLVRAGWPLDRVAHLFIATAQLGLTGSIVADGGLADPGVMWLAVTPLVAAFAGGARLARRAAASACGIVLVLFALGRLGVGFPAGAFGDRPGADLIVALNALGCTGFVALLGVLYDGPFLRHFQHLSHRLAVANDALREELAEREAAQARAEAASRAKGVLLENMSHEFRTPLTSILGFTELITGEATPEHRSLLSAIDRGASRLLGTLDGVLDLAWAESGADALRPRPCDVTREAHRIADAFRPAAQVRGLGLEVSGPPSLALADPEALRRVLRALLDNAIRFTDRGAVTVTVDAEAGRARVRVTDTGPGMTVDDQALAFEPFRQVSEGVARTHEGMGLGLAVAKRLVDVMAGELSIVSAAGEGTTVTVRLPLADLALGGDGASVGEATVAAG